MRSRVLGLGWLAAAALLAGPAYSATVTATPETINDVIAATKPGDVVVLDGNFQSGVLIRNKTWATPVTIRAEKALVSGMRLERVDGVRLIGGTYQSNPTGEGRFGALYVFQSKNVAIEGVEVHKAPLRFHASQNVKLLNSTMDAQGNAVTLIAVDGAEIKGNKFLNMGIDGLDLFSVRNAVVSHNLCAGTKRLGGAHVDCIQIANHKRHFKSENIEISYNNVTGDTMGISAFGGEYRNIDIHHNTLTTSFHNGISLFDTVGGRIWNNTLQPIPGSQFGPGIRTDRSVDPARCGNVIKGVRGGQIKDKKCPPEMQASAQR
jgi:hypothetical protein